MAKGRVIFLGLLLAVGAGLLAFVLKERVNTPLGRTLSPLLGLFGQSTKAADRILSKVLPIDEVDEQALGDAFDAKMNALYGAGSVDYLYVNDLIREMQRASQKPFTYRVYVAPGGPNAFALPGGVLLVTEGLLNALQSEAELVSVLGHEMGHVELGHCFDAARFEMLNRKVGGETLGEIADFVMGALTRHTFSKAQEAEADEYGFSVVTSQGYDPMGTSEAFASLIKDLGGVDDRGIDPLRDYFASHPPLKLRMETYKERGKRWLESHPDEKFYVGKANLQARNPRTRHEVSAEFRP